MADTEENQEAFPQQKCQKEGLGFPIARMLVLLSLSTGMLHGMAMGPYQGKQTGELALFRELLDQLDPDDILLVDKLFCTYFMIALLLERRVDIVVRLHQARGIDLRRAKRLGKNDYLVTWERPDRPDWMDQETYERMPETLQLRLIRVNISEPGFRTKSLDIVTTLTNAEKYSKEDIAELYGRRWLVELDIRSIKVTLGMDELRCKSPEMVRKEAWACLLAYNLVRQKMLQSALQKGVCPRSLSFTNCAPGVGSRVDGHALNEQANAAGIDGGGLEKHRQSARGAPAGTCGTEGRETEAEAVSPLDDASPGGAGVASQGDRSL